MGEKDFSLPNLIAGIVGGIVEGKTLDEGLREVGLSEKLFFDSVCARSSSDSARQYMINTINSEFANLGGEGRTLYLVKKVVCSFDEYEEMSEAINGESTDKFEVIRMIGSNPLIMNYKQENNGIEVYLTGAPTEFDAIKKTYNTDPTVYFDSKNFDSQDARFLDEVINTAFYEHTRESFEILFDTMKYRL